MSLSFSFGLVWFGLVIWRKEKATTPRRHRVPAREISVDFSPLRRRGKIG